MSLLGLSEVSRCFDRPVFPGDGLQSSGDTGRFQVESIVAPCATLRKGKGRLGWAAGASWLRYQTVGTDKVGRASRLPSRRGVHPARAKLADPAHVRRPGPRSQAGRPRYPSRESCEMTHLFWQNKWRRLSSLRFWPVFTAFRRRDARATLAESLAK